MSIAKIAKATLRIWINGNRANLLHPHKLLYIVACDVKASYPSVKRELIKNALAYAVKKYSDFGQAAVDQIVELNMICLDNVVVQHINHFFKQNDGIITGDNHSVSFANITLHYVLLPSTPVLNHALLNALLMTLCGCRMAK